MKSNNILAVIVVMLICGCQQTRSAKVPRMGTEEEQEFVENPCCQTTYGLVMKQHEAAIPLILATFDRYSGETNAPTRCLIIQGALWNAANRANTQFHALIEKGKNDPSESVRLKTARMVSRVSKALKDEK